MLEQQSSVVSCVLSIKLRSELLPIPKIGLTLEREGARRGPCAVGLCGGDSMSLRAGVDLWLRGQRELLATTKRLWAGATSLRKFGAVKFGLGSEEAARVPGAAGQEKVRTFSTAGRKLMAS